MQQSSNNATQLTQALAVLQHAAVFFLSLHAMAPNNTIFLNVEIYCVITTALWSRDGLAVVSLHSPAASMVSSVRFL